MYGILISEIETKEGESYMADRYIFMCTNDLNKLRKSYGWTVDALSERAHISPRTLNRIEYANGTRNESMARKLAEVFERPFEDFFTRVSEYMLRCLKNTVSPLSDWSLIPDMTYYALYVRYDRTFRVVTGKRAAAHDFKDRLRAAGGHDARPN